MVYIYHWLKYIVYIYEQMFSSILNKELNIYLVQRSKWLHTIWVVRSSNTCHSLFHSTVQIACNYLHSMHKIWIRTKYKKLKSSSTSTPLPHYLQRFRTHFQNSATWYHPIRPFSHSIIHIVKWLQEHQVSLYRRINWSTKKSRDYHLVRALPVRLRFFHFQLP